MISRSGSGDTGPSVLYTSALETGPMVATLAGTYTDPDTVIALKLNGGTLCRVPKGGASDAILNPFVLAPGDELEFGFHGLVVGISSLSARRCRL